MKNQKLLLITMLLSTVAVYSSNEVPVTGEPVKAPVTVVAPGRFDFARETIASKLATAKTKCSSAKDAATSGLATAKKAFATAKDDVISGLATAKANPTYAANTALNWTTDNASNVAASVAAFVVAYKVIGKTVLKPKTTSCRVTNLVRHLSNLAASSALAAVVFNKDFGRKAANFVISKVIAAFRA